MGMRYPVLSVFILAVIARPGHASDLTFVTLDPPNSRYTSANGVSGTIVVGDYQRVVGNSTQHLSFIYDGSTYTDLVVPGASNTYATGVSDGTIAGYYNQSGGQNQGFIYDGSTFTTLNVPGAASTSIADVSGGNVVGNYVTVEGQAAIRHGFIYDGSAFTTLDYPGGYFTEVLGVDGDTVVGYYVEDAIVNGTRPYHGFVYDGATFTTLDFPGASHTTLYDISGDTIVGRYSGPNGGGGFVYDGSTFETLGYGLEPHGISGNTMVGSYMDAFATIHGFVAQIPEPACATCVGIVGLGLLARRRVRRRPRPQP